jgi:anti-anti-sigma factor
MKIELKKNGTTEFAFVEIEDELNLYNVADYRTSAYEFLDNNNPSTVVLSLEKVPYIDSSGIGFLVQFQRRSKKANQGFLLYKIQDEVMDSFKLSSIDKNFTFIYDEKEIS